MKTNYIKEYEDQLAKDKLKGKDGWYGGGYSQILAQHIQEIKNEVQEGIDKICSAYGVLVNHSTYHEYQELVLRGKLTKAQALKQFKDRLYGRL